VGSFVPADRAALPVLDRIFTRVGASDDIAGGRSTFMREMTELTEILHGATERSLVLLDEVGRGTSTADGRALARAVTEFIHGEVGAFTLFATHFHGLTDVAADLEGVCNLHFTADRSGEEVRFVHAVVEGAADGSYGVDVARLAGVPTEVTERARQLLEAGPDAPDPDTGGDAADRRTNGHGSGEAAANGADASGELAATLRELDIARMTPLEALNRLDELQRRVEDEG
jgi:DNA mismatch repair protein MutS